MDEITMQQMILILNSNTSKLQSINAITFEILGDIHHVFEHQPKPNEHVSMCQNRFEYEV